MSLIIFQHTVILSVGVQTLLHFIIVGCWGFRRSIMAGHHRSFKRPGIMSDAPVLLYSGAQHRSNVAALLTVTFWCHFSTVVSLLCPLIYSVSAWTERGGVFLYIFSWFLPNALQICAIFNIFSPLHFPVRKPFLKLKQLYHCETKTPCKFHV